MRRPFYFAAWKSSKTMKEVEAFYYELSRRTLELTKNTEVVLAPAYVYFDVSRDKMPRPVQLGAQDVCETDGSGRMGEISATLLKEFGVKYCMVGNLEKRERGESPQIVNRKILSLIKNEIVPILCVGENLSEYEGNRTKEVIAAQLSDELLGVNNPNEMVICYRPAWTTGTGYNATPDFVNTVAQHIRKTVVAMKDDARAGQFPIIYGGGVSKANVNDYMAQSDIDGVFIGASAVNIDEFCGVINGH
ncbi:MAG: triose-phosphate isomerase [Christensenellaceae bacterium]|jgi:triosephosphate isomerase|nr:triose-phosphate isomerase [Christensenellaceae bacterium]